MKCPACGFETPDTQDWCDFCKEPFRKKKAAEPAPSPAPPPPAAAEKKEIPPEILRKLAAEKLAMNKQLPEGIPKEFAVFDAGERIPVISGDVRKAAWLFMGLVVVLCAVFALFGLTKLRGHGKGRPAAPAPVIPGIPGVPGAPAP